MAAKHAEIAGAGLSGLMAATRLAQLGWSVRLHERNSELRMFGAGIWLWENGLRSLQAVGALDAAVARAQVIKEWRIADENGNILFSRPMTPGDRLLLPPRADLYEALIQRAQQMGVDIVTSSIAVSARPEGVLELQSGAEHRADLVVVADGAFSRLRESLLCTASIDYGIEAGIRMLIKRTPGYPDDLITEYWNDRWRLLYNPCTEGEDYIFLSAPVTTSAPGARQSTATCGGEIPHRGGRDRPVHRGQPMGPARQRALPCMVSGQGGDHRRRGARHAAATSAKRGTWPSPTRYPWQQPLPAGMTLSKRCANGRKASAPSPTTSSGSPTTTASSSANGDLLALRGTSCASCNPVPGSKRHSTVACATCLQAPAPTRQLTVPLPPRRRPPGPLASPAEAGQLSQLGS